MIVEFIIIHIILILKIKENATSKIIAIYAKNFIFVRRKRDLCFINGAEWLYHDIDWNPYPYLGNLPNWDKYFGNNLSKHNYLRILDKYII